MKTLPNDISRCANANCPLKNDCLRWTDKGKGQYALTQQTKNSDILIIVYFLKIKIFIEFKLKIISLFEISVKIIIRTDTFYFLR